jgi:hypothetical protein
MDFNSNFKNYLSKHLSIQIINILIQVNIESKYPLKHFIKVDKSTLFFISLMFMKLIRLHKLILNIKFINIVGSVI